ncbi:MAG: branched-chain amino acid ABC transporter permease [Chloroflexi bacterium]|nr:MAG: branched-chain amino acid ABC transporter permease [Chloroflexota bacterium]
MDTLIIILIDGLVFASWLFLIAVGLTFVFGVLRILNLAHGSFYAIGAYTSASLLLFYETQSGLWDRWPYGSFAVILASAVLVGLVVGPVIERGVLQWLYDREPVLQLLATAALLLILDDAVKLIWGVDPYFAFRPARLLPNVHLAGITYSGYSFVLIGVALVSGLSLWLLVNRTRLGRLIQVVIHEPEMGTALGINVPRIYLLTFSVGTALAALGGAFIAPTISIVPGIAIEVGVLAFAVVVIGGLGSPGGAAIGALIVGMVRSAAVHELPQIELFTIYLVMTLVLIIRPRGLFAPEEARKI